MFTLEDNHFNLPSHPVVLQGNGTGLPEILDGEGEERMLRGINVGATVIRAGQRLRRSRHGQHGRRRRRRRGAGVLR